MNVLKGLVISLLSLLLFFSLSVFSLAYLCQSTILNPHFAVRQVDKLDIRELAQDFLEEELAREIPEEIDLIKEATGEIITDHEAWLKGQAEYALRAGYDYFLGSQERLEIIIPLHDFKSDLRESLWRLMQKYLAESPSIIPRELVLSYFKDYYRELINLIPAEFLPAHLEQLSDDQLMSYLDQHYDDILWIIQTAARLPVVRDMVFNQIRPYFDSYYDDFAGEIPDTYIINEDEIPADIMEQLALVREYLGYFRQAYFALIGLMVLLAALIFLINRNIKATTRDLGINLMIIGILELAGVVIFRSLDLIGLVPDLPASLTGWLEGLLQDFILPLQWFSLVILILGIVLLTFSIFYRPRHEQS